MTATKICARHRSLPYGKGATLSVDEAANGKPPAASIAIGLLLAAVAVVLAYESKGLLVGEGVHPAKLAAIRALIEADPSVEEAVRVLTMHFGPQEILLNLDIRFREDLSVAEVTEAIDRLEQKICRAASRREPHLHRDRVAVAKAPSRPAGTARERSMTREITVSPTPGYTPMCNNPNQSDVLQGPASLGMSRSARRSSKLV